MFCYAIATGAGCALRHPAVTNSASLFSHRRPICIGNTSRGWSRCYSILLPATQWPRTCWHAWLLKDHPMWHLQASELLQGLIALLSQHSAVPASLRHWGSAGYHEALKARER